MAYNICRFFLFPCYQFILCLGNAGASYKMACAYITSGSSLVSSIASDTTPATEPE